jgi:hypothetical protein
MKAFRELDRVLRGEALAGQSTRSLFAVNLFLAALYGCCMGSFGLFGRSEPEYWQILASGVKVPTLFLLTLGVTFPSLYVFNTILGTKLPFGKLVRALTAAMAVLIAVLASLGPIVAFFSATTSNYAFILILNVAVFTVSGLFGGFYLFRLLTRESQAAMPLEADDDAPLRATPQGSGLGAVFYVWLVAFGLVGAQMAWVLRPFVGSPWLPFTWFRPREASFFEAVLKSLRQLFAS